VWCGDVVLVGDKVGTVTGYTDSTFVAAMCDGTTQAFRISEISRVVSPALEVIKSFEEAICRQAQS